MRNNRKIIVLSGGFSEEAEVSINTASEIGKALKGMLYEVIIADPREFRSYSSMLDFIRSENPVIVFNGLHGKEGEDGRIQAFLDLEEIAYTGSGFRASAIAMDKYISGILAASLKIRIPLRQLITDIKYIDVDSLSSKIGLPLVIKPNDSGSSVGISIVADRNDIVPAVEKAFIYSHKVLAEAFIDGRELTVTVLDGKALPVVEIKPRKGWYDYANKYTAGGSIYEVPASLDELIEKEIKSQAEKIYSLFDCSAYVRVDFRYDGEQIYFLELNTLPGMTSLSLTPMAAKAEGMEFGQLLEKIIDLSRNRFKKI